MLVLYFLNTLQLVFQMLSQTFPANTHVRTGEPYQHKGEEHRAKDSPLPAELRNGKNTEKYTFLGNPL